MLLTRFLPQTSDPAASISKRRADGSGCSKKWDNVLSNQHSPKQKHARQCARLHSSSRNCGLAKSGCCDFVAFRNAATRREGHSNLPPLGKGYAILPLSILRMRHVKIADTLVWQSDLVEEQL